MSSQHTMHATAVYLRGCAAPFLPDHPLGDVAVILRGPSGSGKSDLALRLMARYGATLIADDQVVLSTIAGQLVCAAPAAIQGLLEVRGLGLIKTAHQAKAPVALVVDLVARVDVPRLPEDATVTLCNIAVPFLKLHAFDDTTPDKIVTALAVVKHPELVIR